MTGCSGTIILCESPMALTLGTTVRCMGVETLHSGILMKITDLTTPITDDYFRTSLYEMSNYGSNNTGLFPGTNLWVRTEPNQHGHVKYRIKLSHPQKGDAIFAIWGNEAQQVAGNWKVTGEELKRVSVLVKQTQQDIRKHIDGLIDSGELATAFQKIKQQIENIK